MNNIFTYIIGGLVLILVVLGSYATFQHLKVVRLTADLQISENKVQSLSINEKNLVTSINHQNDRIDSLKKETEDKDKRVQELLSKNSTSQDAYQKLVDKIKKLKPTGPVSNCSDIELLVNTYIGGR